MKWIEPETIPLEAEISQKFQKAFLLPEHLAKQGITTVEDVNRFLEINTFSQTSPYELPGLEDAVDRISTAIENQEKIGIWGDFDVDGQTSTALLIDALNKLGTETVFHIPVRKTESHGIKKEFLADFMKKGFGLLVTCDTGISEQEALTFAEEKGLDVVITDHHTLPPALPPAHAMINPNFLESTHNLYHLAGVGTAYQLVRALFEKFHHEGEEGRYLDLVALGTIADLAELRDENRYYAKTGLRQMNEGLRPSLNMLLEIAGTVSQKISENHVSFTFAPRLNASGRLDDANDNVLFLLSEDLEFLKKYALKLEMLNSERKLAVDNVYHSAEDILEKHPHLQKYPIILLASGNWEGGVVGIAASRLVEKYNKPVILLKIEGSTAGGSARSIPQVNIIEAIRKNSQYLLNFGGHPMAAGLSLKTENIDAFRESISKTINGMLGGMMVEKELRIDSYLPLSNINSLLLAEMDQLAPFGSGNPAPVLVTKGLEVVEHTSIGISDKHRKLKIQDREGEIRDAIWWKSYDEPIPSGRFDLAYTPKSDDYTQQPKVILEWIDWRESEIETATLLPAARKLEVRDFRMAINQEEIIIGLLGNEECLLWCDGIQCHGKQGFRNRLQLYERKILAIITPPPGYSVLNEALDLVKPREVYLLNLYKQEDSMEAFLRNLGGMIKHFFKSGKEIFNVEEQAGKLGYDAETIISGLKWWQAKGEMTFQEETSGFRIRRNRGKEPGDLRAATKLLQTKLRETAAFRAYYSRADPAALLRL